MVTCNGRRYELIRNNLKAWLDRIDNRKLDDLLQEADTWYPSIGAFEVTVGDVLLYSKLQLERFPTASELEMVLTHYESAQSIDPATSVFNNCKIRWQSYPEGRRLIHPTCCVFVLITQDEVKPEVSGGVLRPYNSYEEGKRIQLISSIYRMPLQGQRQSNLLNRTAKEEIGSSRRSIRANPLSRLESESHSNSNLGSTANVNTSNSKAATLAPLTEESKLQISSNDSTWKSSLHNKLSAPRINSNMYSIAQ